PLTKNEVDVLFEIIRELKNKGTTIIYISHRLDEIFEIADRVTVLRDGTYIDTKLVKDTNVKELIKKMVGREVIQKEDYPSYRKEEIILSLRNLVGNGLSDINLDLYKGEILGLFGLVGSGRTELARLIFGVDKKTDGNILINDELVYIKSTSDAMKKGIAMIPEDRKVDGCFIDKHISWNITISFLKNISRLNIVNKLKETEYYTSFVQKLSIKAASPNQLVGNLSGGNQQKVVIAKSLIRNSKVIIFDEPTRGIDVGARQEIYELIRELAKNGCSILAISSDMEELIHISNRIMVMSEGRLTGELQKSEFNRERILELASQIKGVN
ncbi:MAG: sugar ABC transporter ATP-binding protein, partial [Erysipelotrichaceae bacterium]|nr:sugar ABC transporter ATP-binding protein [Erysipelotrichaceae bacterium]